MDLYDDYPEITMDHYDMGVSLVNGAFPIRPVSDSQMMKNVTPKSLLAAYQASAVDYQPREFNRKFTPLFKHRGVKQPHFKSFRLIPHPFGRDFHNGHPCGKFTKGTRIIVYCFNEQYAAQVEDISYDDGILTFMEPLMVPFFSVDTMGGDVEKQKISTSLRELDKIWNIPGSISQALFLKTVLAGGVATLGDEISAHYGVVGSGKTYRMVQDIKMYLSLGTKSLILVTATTNKALEAVYEELNKAGVPSLQYTRKSFSYSHAFVLKDNPYWQKVSYWERNPPDSSEQRSQRKEDLQNLYACLSKYVILITPSKSIDLRRVFRLSKVPVDVFVDEAGFMTFLDFTPFLNFNLRKLHVSGDLKQQRPWADKLMRVEPPTGLRPYQLMHQAGIQSLGSWLYDMRAPSTYEMKSRRLPAADASIIIPFFYSEGAGHIAAAKWVKSKLLVNDKPGRSSATVNIPPSLHVYPFSTSQSKEKEALRMHHVLDKLKDGKELQFVSSYTHIKESLKQMVDKRYPSLSVSGYETSRRIQGATCASVVSYNPFNLTMFVDDSHLLVSWSRHTSMLYIVPPSLHALLTPGILVQMEGLGIVKLRFSPMTPSKYKAPLTSCPKYRMTLEVQDEKGLKDFFCTGLFETFRKVYQYPILQLLDNTAESQDWGRNQYLYGLSQTFVEQWMDDPYRVLVSKVEGNYKYILLFIRDYSKTYEVPPGFGFTPWGIKPPDWQHQKFFLPIEVDFTPWTRYPEYSQALDKYIAENYKGRTDNEFRLRIWHAMAKKEFISASMSPGFHKSKARRKNPNTRTMAPKIISKNEVRLEAPINEVTLEAPTIISPGKEVPDFEGFFLEVLAMEQPHREFLQK